MDDSVYGSLAVYRQEVLEELSLYVQNHSLAELETAMTAALETAEDTDALAALWAEMRDRMKG